MKNQKEETVKEKIRMVNKESTTKGAYSELIELKDIFKKTKVKLIYFIIPIFISFFVASLEGLSIGLLLPLAKGILEKDFSFLQSIPVFNKVLEIFPNFFGGSQTVIFATLLVFIFTATLLKSVLQYAKALVVAYQKQQASCNLRDYIFFRCMTFGKLFYDKTNAGFLQNIIINVTTTAAHLIELIERLTSFIFMLIVYILIMIKISWQLTMFTTLFLPVMNYSLKWIIKKIKISAIYMQKQNRRMNEKLFSLLSCISLVKSYSNEGAEKRKFSSMNKEMARWKFSITKKNQLIGPIQEIITLFGISILVLVMAYMVLKKGNLDIPGFIVFFYLLRKIVGVFGGLNSIRSGIANFSGPLIHLREILSDEGKFFIKDGTKEFKGLKEKIKIENLTFSYVDRLPVLKDASFSIEKGKMTAIVGPTGSGKTTIISLLIRFYEIPKSTILIDGIDIKEFTLKSLRKHMALVSQETLLFNDTLRNNIIYGLNRTILEKEIIEATKKARLYEFIKRLPEGFETVIGDRGVKLSGGEKQRLSIARALLKKAEILMLDEATSSLDSITEKRIQESIDEAVNGRTAIVIAHRLSTIKNADKIIFIENGEVVEQGKLKELLDKKGKFYNHWMQQKFD